MGHDGRLPEKMEVPKGKYLKHSQYAACSFSGIAIQRTEAVHIPCIICLRALDHNNCDGDREIDLCDCYFLDGSQGVYLVRFPHSLKSVVVLRWRSNEWVAFDRDRYVVDGPDVHFIRWIPGEPITAIRIRFQYMSFADRVRSHAEHYDEGPYLGI